MAALDPMIEEGIKEDANEGTGKEGVDARAERPASSDSAPELTSDKQVIRALDDFAVALVKADGGEVYLVRATSDEVHLHLAGTCAGCPGATMTRERLLAPTVKGVLPKATLTVTTGWRIPEGAVKIGS